MASVIIRPWASSVVSHVTSTTSRSVRLSATSSAVRAPPAEATAVVSAAVALDPAGTSTRMVMEYPGLGVAMAAPLARATLPDQAILHPQAASARVMRQRQELGPRPGVVAQDPEQARGDRRRAGRLHAPERHAQVLGLDDDADPDGSELGVEPVRHLDRQPLLDLR